MKKAIDTNVLVRFLVGERSDQREKAQAVIERNEIHLSLTVLLETEWVLRAVYQFAPAAICNAFKALAGLPQISIENPVILAKAIALTEQGADFADALHLASAEQCETFFTFDKDFIKFARSAGIDKVRAP